jgi:hypothetical protein
MFPGLSLRSNPGNTVKKVHETLKGLAAHMPNPFRVN